MQETSRSPHSRLSPSTRQAPDQPLLTHWCLETSHYSSKARLSKAQSRNHQLSMGRESNPGGSKRCFRAVATGRSRSDVLSKRSPAAFEIDVTQVCEVVVPLPKQVRERWSDWGTGRGDDQRYSSLEGITARLEKARKKREVSLLACPWAL